MQKVRGISSVVMGGVSSCIPVGAFGRRLLPLLAALFLLQSCADVDVPGPRDVVIPAPTIAGEREEAVNERPDSVLYLPLGRDVLVPEISADDPLPSDFVGPFELRSETLAGALQLILSDYDISLAFETDKGLTQTVTVANLRGPLNRVVRRVCSLADLYCAYEDGLMIVKEYQTFTVKIPPISQDTSFMQNVATGLQAITGKSPIVDASTRTIVYEATQRTADAALRYFQRMRASTALIVFETYIWEVALSSGNSAGIRWDMMKHIGKYATGFTINGAVGADFSNPISIGLPTTQDVTDANGDFAPTEVFNFLSQFGAVKTISQPQITVLSGSEAKLRAADTQNYVSRVSETIDNGQSTTAVDTSSVDTGFTVTIQSAWDNATVYADIDISLTDVSEIDDFDFTSGGGGTTTVQLPKTTERELQTQIRIRPGDSVLIAGLVRESDAFDTQGPGLMKPFFPSSRTATTQNLELVFLLRPRVVVYTSPSEDEHYNTVRGAAVRAEEKKEAALQAKLQGAEESVAVVPDDGALDTVIDEVDDFSEFESGDVSAATDEEPFEYDFSPFTERESVQPDPVVSEPVLPAYVQPPVYEDWGSVPQRAPVTLSNEIYAEPVTSGSYTDIPESTVPVYNENLPVGSITGDVINPSQSPPYIP